MEKVGHRSEVGSVAVLGDSSYFPRPGTPGRGLG